MSSKGSFDAVSDKAAFNRGCKDSSRSSISSSRTSKRYITLVESILQCCGGVLRVWFNQRRGFGNDAVNISSGPTNSPFCTGMSKLQLTGSMIFRFFVLRDKGKERSKTPFHSLTSKTQLAHLSYLICTVLLYIASHPIASPNCLSRSRRRTREPTPAVAS